MPDRRPPPPFDPGDRSPRHLRVDDRPIVRDLDERQLAAEALAALRAERVRAGSDDLIPFDRPPAAQDVVMASASGRHRRDILPPLSSHGDRVRATGSADTSGVPPVSAPARHRTPRVAFSPSSAPPPPVSRPHHRIDDRRGEFTPPVPAAVRTEVAGSRPARRSPPRGVLVAVPLLLAMLTAILAIAVLSDSDDRPATVGTPPEVTATTPSPSALGTVSRDAASSGTDLTSPTPISSGVTPDPGAADTGTERATAPVPSTPPPAVLATLSPGDTGFGWPSTAFGRPGD